MDNVEQRSLCFGVDFFRVLVGAHTSMMGIFRVRSVGCVARVLRCNVLCAISALLWRLDLGVLEQNINLVADSSPFQFFEE